MTIPSAFTVVYWVIALFASVLLGWKAIEIFTDIPKKEEEHLPPPSWWWQQRWLNFLGSLVGWLSLWVLVRRYWGCILGDCSVEPNYWDMLAAFIAFVGVTGYLPFTIVGLISSIYIVGIKLADMIKGLLPKP